MRVCPAGSPVKAHAPMLSRFPTSGFGRRPKRYIRHSAASFMINAGIDLYAVGRILGHADHQSTMRYSHLADDTLLAAVEAGAARLNLTSAVQPGAA